MIFESVKLTQVVCNSSPLLASCILRSLLWLFKYFLINQWMFLIRSLCYWSDQMLCNFSLNIYNIFGRLIKQKCRQYHSKYVKATQPIKRYIITELTLLFLKKIENFITTNICFSHQQTNCFGKEINLITRYFPFLNCLIYVFIKISFSITLSISISL